MHRPVVDRDQASSHHGIEGGRGEALLGEHGLQGFDLVGLHVDEEVVRRIRRQLIAPLGEQIAAHQADEQQHHDAEAEGDHLRDAAAGTPGDVGETETPCRADSLSQAIEETNQRVCDGAQRQHRAGAGAEHVGGEACIAGVPGYQADAQEHGNRISADGCCGQRTEIAAQHACR